MSGPRIGSVCSGYGGLDMAVQQVFGGSVAWFFEYEAAPSKVLAYHWPDVANYGDLTMARWHDIERCDIMCGGTPCQDLSGAGKRAGMTEGTRSNLWVQMREGIAIQRPALVIWENVRGAYSACADSELGRCPRCMGEPGEHRPFLRALGRVLGDLSALGYDAEVVPLRASDVGAAHGRYRVFVVAYDADPERLRRDAGWLPDAIEAARRWALGFDSGRGGVSADSEGERRGKGRTESTRELRGSSDYLSSVATSHRLPYLTPAEQQRVNEYVALWESLEDKRPYFVSEEGKDYWPAIHRHEQMIGRPVPPPSLPDGKKGQFRFSPVFDEWLMGMPEGHVTGYDIGLTANEMKKACGNGVVTQQAVLALSIAGARVMEFIRSEVTS